MHVGGRWQRTGRSMLKCQTCGKSCATEYLVPSTHSASVCMCARARVCVCVLRVANASRRAGTTWRFMWLAISQRLTGWVALAPFLPPALLWRPLRPPSLLPPSLPSFLPSFLPLLQPSPSLSFLARSDCVCCTGVRGRVANTTANGVVLLSCTGRAIWLMVTDSAQIAQESEERRTSLVTSTRSVCPARSFTLRRFTRYILSSATRFG